MSCVALRDRGSVGGVGGAARRRSGRRRRWRPRRAASAGIGKRAREPARVVDLDAADPQRRASASGRARPCRTRPGRAARGLSPITWSRPSFRTGRRAPGRWRRCRRPARGPPGSSLSLSAPAVRRARGAACSPRSSRGRVRVATADERSARSRPEHDQRRRAAPPVRPGREPVRRLGVAAAGSRGGGRAGFERAAGGLARRRVLGRGWRRLPAAGGGGGFAPLGSLGGGTRRLLELGQRLLHPARAPRSTLRPIRAAMSS